jgi:hypothetical protein
MTSEELHQLSIEYQSCFGTPHGQKVLEDLSKYCYERRNTFCEGNHDKQNVNNGKRAVILYIRKWLSHNPEDEIQETAEHEGVV